MAIPTKGLNNIRTLSGRVDQLSLPYRAYMQITCLEMEKSRRDRERKTASKRVEEIDARLGEIDQEKQELFRAVAPRQRASGAPAGPGGEARTPASAGGFKIRY